ncbi:MAG TPA: YhcH/YjgK/YiaL family protein [Bacteroidales bacterium]|nr:YhcH/YjgK/YiaL family protein [Bacteroidales bacterium]HQJ20539.1 YhcH/YjgK/YiaL family protein [Bacteroidales bacterium]HRC89735.1 YhcH/YjgK/YiaL family protein [Bacteroidales bacterium]
MSTKKIDKWYSAGEWLKGCQLKPHNSVNKKAFAREYFAKKELWDKSFEWLRTNDLDTISPGRYIIDGGNVTATVSEEPAPEFEKVRWEKHKNFNDLQYIVKGKARMGSVPVTEASIAESYDPKRDIEFYNAEGELYDAGPGTFFIFTPDDVHRPGIKADDFDGPVKKIVIKIRSADSE